MQTWPSASVIAAAGQLVERLEADEADPLGRGRLAVEADLAGALGIEDDQRDRQALVLVGRVGPRVVELVQHVRR